MTHYVSVKEAAERLGVSTKTIYQRLWTGKFNGVVRVGRAIRIPEEALLDFPAYEPPQRGVVE